MVEAEAKTRKLEKAKLYKAKDEEIKEKRHDLLIKQKASVAHKKYNFAVTRTKEQEIKAKMIDRNVYAQSINDMSLTLAKTAKARRTKNNVVSMLTS